MDVQGLQALRSEIEAVVTLQAAFNRLALSVDENATSEWTGPRPDEIDGLASDDGTFQREEILEVRKRASEALAARYREVATAIRAQAELMAILGKALAAGTGGVAALDGPEPGGVLGALARTGALRLDWAESAAALIRGALGAVQTASAAEQPGSAMPAGQPKAPRKAAKRAAKPSAPQPRSAEAKRAKGSSAAPAKRAPPKAKPSSKRKGAATARARPAKAPARKAAAKRPAKAKSPGARAAAARTGRPAKKNTVSRTRR